MFSAPVLGIKAAKVAAVAAAWGQKAAAALSCATEAAEMSGENDLIEAVEPETEPETPESRSVETVPEDPVDEDAEGGR